MPCIVVCPLHRDWHRIWELLSQHAESLKLPEPPGPIILTGWWATNDHEKHEQWKSTLAWMDEHGFQLAPTLLSEVEWHVVDELSDDFWGKREADWKSTSSTRPDEGLVVAALAELKKDWQSVAGENLASITMPIKFTGQKRRRLLMSYEEGALPPWGSWVSLGGDTASFTGFRARVNACIAPLEVDHIDFEIAQKVRLS